MVWPTLITYTPIKTGTQKITFGFVGGTGTTQELLDKKLTATIENINIKKRELDKNILFFIIIFFVFIYKFTYTINNSSC